MLQYVTCLVLMALAALFFKISVALFQTAQRTMAFVVPAAAVATPETANPEPMPIERVLP